MNTCKNCGKTLRGGPRFPFTTLGFSHNQSARTLGVSGSTWQDYMCHGVTREAAERIADKLGVHAYELWPDLIDHDAGIRPCDGCGTPFVPYRANNRWCSTRCRENAAKRRYRATDRGRSKTLRYRRRYYQECAEYERASRRERYRRQKEDAA